MTTILVYVACGVVGAALGHAAAWLIYLALDARERSRARLCGFLRGYWQAASGRALDTSTGVRMPQTPNMTEPPGRSPDACIQTNSV